MKKIQSYLDQYRKIKSKNIFLRDLIIFTNLVLGALIILLSFEYLFYFSSFTRRNYFIIFITISICIFAYIVFKWLVYRNSLFNINSDLFLAKELGNKFDKIKDRLINIIQIQKVAPDLDLTKLAIKDLKKDFNQIKINESLVKLDKSYYYYSLISVLILVAIFSINPLKNAGSRIMQFHLDFNPPIPFTLNEINKQSNALSGDTILIKFNGEGELPDSIPFYFVVKNKQKMKMIPQKDQTYQYKINNIKSDLQYWTKFEPYSFISAWDSIGTSINTIKVKERPLILNSQFTIKPPKYTKEGEKILKADDFSQINVTNGSKISFNFDSNKILSSSWMVLNEERIDLTINDSKIFGEFEIYQDSKLQVYILDQNSIPNLNPTQFLFFVNEDRAPSIIVNNPKAEFEINQQSYSIPLNFNVNDDFGIEKIWIEYKTISMGYESELYSLSLQQEFKKNITECNIIYNWNINNLGLLMGDEMHFWILIKDNNPNKDSITKTKKFIGKLPSFEDQFEYIFEEQEEAENWLDNIQESIEEISDITDEAQLELLKEDNISIENEKKIEKSFEKIEEIKNEIEKIQKSIENITDKAEKNNLFDKNLLDKYEYFQEMLQDIMTPELMDAMNELQEAMKNLDPNQIAEALENFEFNLEEFEEQLDRFIDMFELAQAEQKINELSELIENISNKQNELVEQIDEDFSQQSLLNSKSTKQEKRFNNFEDLLNQSIDQIASVSENTSTKLDEINKSSIVPETNDDLNKTTQNIQNNDQESASSNSKLAQNNINNILEEIENIKEEFINESIQKIKDEFVLIINDIITISNQQEKIILNSRGLKSNSPTLPKINKQQDNINREISQLLGQLVSLSNKTFFVTPSINRAFGQSSSSIIHAISSFEQKKITPGLKSQKEALSNINLATQLLLDALNEMLNSNSASGFEQFMESLEEMGKKQQGINQGTMQMQLNQLGLMQQEKLMEQLQNQQEQLKKQLDDLLGEFPGEGSGSMEKVSEDMDEIIKDFKDKKINRETIERQKQILSRMLDKQKSLNPPKDFGNKRKAKTGEIFQYDGATSLPTNLGDKNVLLINAMESAMDEGHSNENQKIIRNYFLNLQNDDK